MASPEEIERLRQRAQQGEVYGPPGDPFQARVYQEQDEMAFQDAVQAEVDRRLSEEPPLRFRELRPVDDSGTSAGARARGESPRIEPGLSPPDIGVAQTAGEPILPSGIPVTQKGMGRFGPQAQRLEQTTVPGPYGAGRSEQPYEGVPDYAQGAPAAQPAAPGQPAAQSTQPAAQPGGGGGIPRYQPSPFIDLETIDQKFAVAKQAAVKRHQDKKNTVHELIAKDAADKSSRGMVTAPGFYDEQLKAVSDEHLEADLRSLDLAREQIILSDPSLREAQIGQLRGGEEQARALGQIGETDAGRVEATRGAALTETARQQQQKLYAEHVDRTQRREADIDAQLQQYSEALDDFRKAKPATMESYLSKRPGGMVLAGIAMALGAAAQVMTKGVSGNPAMEIIFKGLDAEVRAQELAIEQKRVYAGHKVNIVNQMRARLKDDRMAYDFARLALAENLQSELEQGRLAGVAARAGVKGQALRAEFAIGVERMRAEILDKQKSAWDKNEEERRKRHAAAVYANASAQQTAQRLQTQGFVVKEKKGERPFYLSGQGGFASDKKTYDEMLKADYLIANGRELAIKLKSIAQEAKRSGMDELDFTKRAIAADTRMKLLKNNEQIQMQGVLMVGEQAPAVASMPTGPEISLADAEAVADNQLQWTETLTRNRFKSGLTPGYQYTSPADGEVYHAIVPHTEDIIQERIQRALQRRGQ
jgi:hypothetical protein